MLHELAHFALGLDSGLPHHGRTFARILLDATDEFCGADRARTLADSYRAHGVHVGRPPRVGPFLQPGSWIGPDGQLRYGWDERIRLGRGHILRVSCTTPDGDPQVVTGRFEGYERGSSIVRLSAPDDTITRVATVSVWDVADA